MTTYYTSRTRTSHVTSPSAGSIELGHFLEKVSTMQDGEWIETWVNNNQIYDYTYPLEHISEQLCVDSTHPGPPYKSGGHLKILKMDRVVPYGLVYGSGDYLRRDGGRRYIGGFHAPDESSFGLGMDMSMSNFFANSTHFPSYGSAHAEAWNKTKPRMEKAGGAVFAAELRDIPRMLKTSAGGFHDAWKAVGGNLTTRDMRPKKAADHFLNHQFGWAPFLSDLRKFDRVIKDRKSIISKLSKDNGQSVRRRGVIKSGSETTLLGAGTGMYLFPNSIHTGSYPGHSFYRPDTLPTWELHEELTTQCEAVGRFKYYRPEFDDKLPDHSSAWNSAMRHATILGLRVNPSNLYKATPWSWAVDWFVNVGDHVDYLNDILVDSIACQYLYVMLHQIRRRKFIQTLPMMSGDVTLEFSRVIESKQREPVSSPFGPGLVWSSLTPRQLAIAAALGISRW